MRCRPARPAGEWSAAGHTQSSTERNIPRSRNARPARNPLARDKRRMGKWAKPQSVANENGWLRLPVIGGACCMKEGERRGVEQKRGSAARAVQDSAVQLRQKYLPITASLMPNLGRLKATSTRNDVFPGRPCKERRRKAPSRTNEDGPSLQGRKGSEAGSGRSHNSTALAECRDGGKSTQAKQDGAFFFFFLFFCHVHHQHLSHLLFELSADYE